MQNRKIHSWRMRLVLAAAVICAALPASTAMGQGISEGLAARLTPSQRKVL